MFCREVLLDPSSSCKSHLDTHAVILQEPRDCFSEVGWARRRNEKSGTFVYHDFEVATGSC
jgi:hypothetical protein